MEITYDYYRIFYYVAKYKNLTHAAEILHSNQPNVTKFMNKLEEQIGCKLIIRSNKGIQLTPEGEKLFSHVSIAYEQLREAELELSSDRAMNSGIVRIGATETALHGILLPVLNQFRTQYPGIRLMITNYSTRQAISALKKGAVDFSLAATPTDAPMDFQETTLLNFNELLIAAKDSPYASLTELTAKEIIRQPVVGLGQHSKTYELYSALFLEHNLEWQPDIDAATADQILPMIKAGLGIGFIPELMAEQAINQGEVCVIKVSDLTIPRRSLVLIEDKTQHLNIAANTLKKMLLST
ncbi:MAG: LysR family transcriptional regulator [Clostridiales bacterium]|nr:LysR family transcriptional regulator [Clostridiales bacterium]